MTRAQALTTLIAAATLLVSGGAYAQSTPIAAIAPPGTGTSPPPVSVEDVTGALEGFAGVGVFSIGKIKDRLSAAGYNGLSSANFTIGGHAHASRGRLQLGGTGAYFFGPETDHASPSNLTASTYGGWGGFDIAYAVVDEVYFEFAPMLTLGTYAFGIKLYEKGSTPFDSALSTPKRDTRLLQQGALLGVSLPTKLTIPPRQRQRPATRFADRAASRVSLGVPGRQLVAQRRQRR